MEETRATFNVDGLSARETKNAEMFVANYYGETEVAKWALGFVKGGVHDGEFIPWTVMNMALKLLDWKSTIELVENDEGGYIFRDTVFMETSQKKIEGVDDKGNDIIRSTDTSNNTSAFYVKVRIVYFGEETIHEYAVLDTGHQPVQYLNSQLVNKAIQRNKARAISLVTGIGLPLWTREAIEQESDDVGKETAVVIEPKKQKLTKAKPNDTMETVLDGNLEAVVGDDLELVLARKIAENVTDEEFLAKHKKALEFAKKTFNVDYMEKNINKLAKTLLNVNDLEGFAKMILGEE